jgi:hypothetical protein
MVRHFLGCGHTAKVVLSRGANRLLDLTLHLGPDEGQ